MRESEKDEDSYFASSFSSVYSSNTSSNSSKKVLPDYYVELDEFV